jgi:hypothetical protein
MVSRPQFAFDNEGNIRPFGIGEHKSILSLGVVSIALAIWSFYMFTLIDLFFQKV